MRLTIVYLVINFGCKHAFAVKHLSVSFHRCHLSILGTDLLAVYSHDVVIIAMPRLQTTPFLQKFDCLFNRHYYLTFGHLACALVIKTFEYISESQWLDKVVEVIKLALLKIVEQDLFLLSVTH